MISYSNLYPRHRDNHQSWFLRKMCREIKDYLLGLSLDDNYSSIIYNTGAFNGETSEILAQEFPFLNVYCIDDWTAENQYAFDERSKFYNNLYRMDGDLELLQDQIENPVLVYIENCGNPECIDQQLNFWLSRMERGAIIGGNSLLRRKFTKQRDYFNFKKTLVQKIGHPHIQYADGSWIYYI